MANVGDKIKLHGDKQTYTIRARDSRFVIMTTPFNLQKTYFYTIVDLKHRVRGASNKPFGPTSPYDTPEGAAKNLEYLQSGEMEVSCKIRTNLSQDEIDVLTI